MGESNSGGQLLQWQQLMVRVSWPWAITLEAGWSQVSWLEVRIVGIR
jgi:hypothetical protein